MCGDGLIGSDDDVLFVYNAEVSVVIVHGLIFYWWVNTDLIFLLVLLM